MHWTLELLVVILILGITLYAVIRMRLKHSDINSPTAFNAISAINQFVDPGAHRAQAHLEELRNATVALPSAESDPLQTGEITIRIEKE
jgi:hypothetical protein